MSSPLPLQRTESLASAPDITNTTRRLEDDVFQSAGEEVTNTNTAAMAGTRGAADLRITPASRSRLGRMVAEHPGYATALAVGSGALLMVLLQSELGKRLAARSSRSVRPSRSSGSKGLIASSIAGAKRKWSKL